MSHATATETNAAAGATTLLAARQQATAATCVPQPDACCVPDALSWMNNDAGQNPCQQLQSVMQLCSPTFGIQVLPHDLSCPLISASGDPNPCCCSTVSYALFAACHMCQSYSGSVTSYYAFLNRCGSAVELGRLPTTVTEAQAASLDLPEWAFMVPTHFSDSWNSSAALQNATMTAQDVSKHTEKEQPGGISPGAIAAIIASLGIAAFIILFVYLFRIRRRKHKRNGSKAPLLPGVLTLGGKTYNLSSNDPNSKSTLSFGYTQTGGNGNISRPAVMRATVDLADELDQPSLHEPGAPRLPWDHGRKLNVPKYDVERDEYGQICAVIGPGVGGQPLVRVESWQDEHERPAAAPVPPQPPPKPPKPPPPTMQERRVMDWVAATSPSVRQEPVPGPSMQRRPSREPAPIVSPALEHAVAGMMYTPPTASHARRTGTPPNDPLVQVTHSTTVPVPAPAPARRSSQARRHRRDQSLPRLPPDTHSPSTPRTRDRPRGPLMVRNSGVSASGSSTNGDGPPMAPSAQFLASVSGNGMRPQQQLPDAFTLGLADRPAPDAFALGPPPSTYPRPMPYGLSVVTTGGGGYGPSTATATASATRSRQLPPIPVFSPLSPPQPHPHPSLPKPKS